MYIICKNIQHIQNKVLVIIYLMQVLKEISLLDPIFLIIFMKILFSSASNVSTSKYQIFQEGSVSFQAKKDAKPQESVG